MAEDQGWSARRGEAVDRMVGVADRDAIYRRMAALIGQAPWDVSLGWGSFVTMNFGPQRPGRWSVSPPAGAWHLWIQEVAWRLEEGDGVVAGCEDLREELAVAVKRMQDKRLLSIDLRLPAFDASLTFEQAIVLHLFPKSTERGELWSLFTPDGCVLNVGPGTAWYYHRSDEPSPTDRDDDDSATDEGDVHAKPQR